MKANVPATRLCTLADGGTGPVELKIGLSFVSAENAKQNLEKEIGDKSFDVIRGSYPKMGKIAFVYSGKRRHG
jgi:putative alpha-1,2-mannosidase